MQIFNTHKSKIVLRKLTAGFVLFVFTLTSFTATGISWAQGIGSLPAPGVMVQTTPAFIPSTLRGLIVHPDNPFLFDFVIDNGHSGLEGEALRTETEKLVKFFLASLTLPEDELWVNLSPFEKDRIIPDEFGQTEMGQTLLAQDYLLKQLMASFLYPEKEIGQKFWERIREKAQERFGSVDIPTDMFNKVWIVPDEALIQEAGDRVFIVASRLKVMLEQDYLVLRSSQPSAISFQTSELNDESSKSAKLDNLARPRPTKESDMGGLTTRVLKQVVIPELEREVNEGRNFARLRQIYNSFILATWYKKNLKDSILNRSYSDRKKISGLETNEKNTKEKIYQQYLDAFKTGVYDYIKEEYDPATQEIIPRKYFSGGVSLTDAAEATEKPFIAEGRISLATTELTDPAVGSYETLAALSGEEIESLERRYPAFDWEKGAGIFWPDLVRSLERTPDAKTANQKRYLANQTEAGRLFLLLLGEMAAGKKFTPGEFGARMQRMNEVLLTGESGQRIYVTPSMRRRYLGISSDNVEFELTDELIETVKGFAGVTRFFARYNIDSRMQLFTEILEKFMALQAADRDEAVKMIALFYHNGMGNPFIFEYGNESLIMNAVNIMLRLSGFNGLAHDLIRRDQMHQKDKFAEYFLEIVKETRKAFATAGDASVAAEYFDQEDLVFILENFSGGALSRQLSELLNVSVRNGRFRGNPWATMTMEELEQMAAFDVGPTAQMIEDIETMFDQTSVEMAVDEALRSVDIAGDADAAPVNELLEDGKFKTHVHLNSAQVADMNQAGLTADVIRKALQLRATVKPGLDNTYGFFRTTREKEQFHLIREDFEGFVEERSAGLEGKTIVLYMLGLGEKYPLEIEQIIEMMKNIIKTGRKDDARNWTLRVIGLDTLKLAYDNADKVFKKYAQDADGPQVQFEMRRYNVLDRAVLERLAKRFGQGDYIFDRRTAYVNRYAVTGEFNSKHLREIARKESPEYMAAIYVRGYLNLVNIFGTLAKPGSRFIVEPGLFELSDIAKYPYPGRHLNLPGTTVLTNPSFVDFPNSSGVSVVREPEKTADMLLTDLLKAIEQSDASSAGSLPEKLRLTAEAMGLPDTQALKSMLGANVLDINAVFNGFADEVGLDDLDRVDIRVALLDLGLFDARDILEPEKLNRARELFIEKSNHPQKENLTLERAQDIVEQSLGGPIELVQRLAVVIPEVRKDAVQARLLEIWTASAKISSHMSKQTTNFLFLDVDNFLIQGKGEKFGIYGRIYGEIYARAKNNISVDDQTTPLPEEDIDEGKNIHSRHTHLLDPEHIGNMLAHLRAQDIIPAEGREDYIRYFEKRFKELIDTVDFVPGAKELLGAVQAKREEGYKVKVVLLSNSSSFTIHFYSDHFKFNDYTEIDQVIGVPWNFAELGLGTSETFKANQIEKVVREYMKKEAAGDEEIFVSMGGDSTGDIKAAVMATERGITTYPYGVPTGTVDREALINAGAKVVVNSLLEYDQIFAAFESDAAGAREWEPMEEFFGLIKINRQTNRIIIGNGEPIDLAFDLIVERHGKTKANLLEFLQGQADEDINQLDPEEGIKPAEDAAKVILNELRGAFEEGRPVIAVSTGLGRADDTGQAFVDLVNASNLGVTLELEKKSFLKEQDFRSVDNTSFADVAERFFEQNARRQQGDIMARLADAENFYELLERMLRGLLEFNEEIKDRFKYSKKRPVVVIFGHAYALNALRILLGDQNMLHENGEYLEYRDTKTPNTQPLRFDSETREFVYLDAAATPGGIDFHPKHLEFKTQAHPGGGQRVLMPTVHPRGGLGFQGLIPIIINIRPVTNLPLLLGERAPSKTTQSLDLSWLN